MKTPKQMQRIGLVALGVPDEVVGRVLKFYMAKVHGQAFYHRSVPNATKLAYYKLGGISSRCTKVAAAYVWRCTKLVYMTTFDRRHELEDAIAVAIRVGRPFEVYLFRNKNFDLHELVQCEKRNK